MTPGFDVRRVAVATLVVYTCVVAWLVLSPTSEVPSAVVHWLADRAAEAGAPDRLASAGRIEFAANVAVTIPAAALAAFLWGRLGWRDWTAYGFMVCASVEVVQGLLLPERAATFRDVVANTLGVALGSLLVAGVRLRARRRPTGTRPVRWPAR